jgi:hypothetical protein
MTAIRRVVAGLSGITLAGGLAVGASVALASSANATCADLGGTFAGGKCTVVSGGTTTVYLIAGPSGTINENNPWTRTVTTPSTVDVYHGNGPGSLISSTTTGVGSETIANPGGHEVDSVPGGGAPAP